MHSKKIQKAICGTPDHPLKIGNAEIQCYVLEDEKRVLIQTEMIRSLGMSKGSSGGSSGDRLAKFIQGQRIKPYISNDLMQMTNTPLKFKTPKGNVAYGYEAEVLAQICFAVLEADQAGLLQKQQKHIAKQCGILVKGFAIVGINALVDEVTGYQDIRAKNNLAQILEKYILKEFKAWTKTFPDEFYREMFRLKSWSFDPSTVRKPSVIGRYTNDVVYERLAPGVLDELQRVNPTIKGKGRVRKHHQWLTGDVGHPKLKEHLSGVMALMRASANWRSFKDTLARAYPKQNEQIPLALDVGED